MGQAAVLGGRTYVWPNGSVTYTHDIMFWAKSWQAVGGQTALSKGAALYLGHQIEELAQNPDLQPVFIQWTATAEGGGALNTTDPHDGWYVISNLRVDYTNAALNGYLQVTATVEMQATPPPRPHAMGYSGGALTTTGYSGSAQIAVAFPVGSTDIPTTSVSRTGSEGAIPLSVAPSTSLQPLPFTPSSTLANLFLGGCRVYDTVTAGSNAVPTDGSLVHATWLEVFGVDHRYDGDCIVTNGLLLFRFQPALTSVCHLYLWSTSQATPGWLSVGPMRYRDVANVTGTGRSFTPERIGFEEVTMKTLNVSPAGKYGQHRFRLARGHQFARIDSTPLSEANTNAFAMFFDLNTAVGGAEASGTVAKIAYNSVIVADEVNPGNVSLTNSATYGYGAAFNNSTSQPFIAGLLWLVPPDTATSQPKISANTLAFGETTNPTQNATRSYGVFAVPYGTTADTTQRLQAEAESGTLGTGWSSVALGQGESNALTAKCLSGTASGNADTFGTAFVPQAGVYDVWFRMKVLSAAGGGAEMKVGLYNSTDSVYVGSTTYAANAMTTSFAWYRVAAAVTPTATKSMRFRAETTATIGTDWYVDEAVMVPLTLSTANTGPQEIWQQFASDRPLKMTRL